MPVSIVATDGQTNVDGNGTLSQGMTQGTGRKLGFLTWWTLHQESYKVQDVIDAAKAAGIPKWMIDRITPRSDKSAWQAATQLGVNGVQAAKIGGEGKDQKPRYVVRDVAKDCRALVREVLDADSKVAESYTVAQVYFGQSAGTIPLFYSLTHEGYQKAVPADVEDQVHGMIKRLKAEMGLIDVGRVRTLVLDWLVDNHRITVRGTGGVYLVPVPKTQGKQRRTDPRTKAIESELIAIRNWVSAKPLEGLFSIVEVSDKGATTVDVFVKAALDELKDELQTVDDNLEKYAKNPAMNDGSKMNAASDMLGRLAKLGERAEFLTEALGDEIAVINTMMDLVRKRALTMQTASLSAVNAYQVQKLQAKAETPKTPLQAVQAAQTPVAASLFDLEVNIAPVTLPAPAGNGKAKDQKGKKSGVTAKAAKKL